MTELAGARILVTGGSGFFGGAVAERLVGVGATVVVPTRTGAVPQRLAGLPSLECGACLDLADPSSVEQTLRDLAPDMVVHAAAHGVAGSGELQGAIAVNALGTAALAQSAATLGVRAFVWIGSALEYPASAPFLIEETRPFPNTVYGLSKAMGTSVIEFLTRSHGLRSVSLRPFSMYGPWEPANKLLPYTILSAAQNHFVDITYGDQERDYVFIDDAVDAVILALSGGLTIGETYNVASGRPIRVRDLVTRTLDMMGCSSLLRVGVKISDRPEMQTSRAGVDKLRATGWSPRTELDAGLRRTIDWYTSELRIC